MLLLLRMQSAFSYSQNMLSERTHRKSCSGVFQEATESYVRRGSFFILRKLDPDARCGQFLSSLPGSRVTQYNSRLQLNSEALQLRTWLRLAFLLNCTLAVFPPMTEMMSWEKVCRFPGFKSSSAGENGLAECFGTASEE